MFGQFVPVGSGSYTTVFPGVDAAGRNGYPSGAPFVTGAAANKPIPTNDWWSAQVKNPHTDNLFNYPFTMKSVNEGLVVSYIPWGPIDNILPVVVGVSGLNASQANVSDHTDWTVTMDWSASGKQFQATMGIGMPFIYFEKDASSLASVTVNQGNVTISGEVLIVEDARNGADFAVYAPTGSSWQQSGNQYTSSLNGQNYWSLAFLPASAGSLTQAAQDYQQYAYVFPTNTRVDWNYDASTSILTTDFNVDVEVKEGTDSTALIGLLPHQWDNLASPVGFLPHTYPTVRGELKTISANSFNVENIFYGILPTLPAIAQYSPSYDPSLMGQKVSALENDQLNPWTDSYNEGQEMNRLIQTARIAELNKDTVAFNKLRQTVKTRLEDWLTAQANEVAFIFYYNATWTSLIGYPAGHGQDVNINDHHFHWGYFIHAAAFMEQFEPGWAAQWGPMVDLLIRDAASPNRNDNLFPFLRNFSPYAGHCWANGFATFPQGNDQESTSESMQFNSSLIHWGSVTGNDAIRDLGIYLYTTEQTAVEEYWFDTKSRNFGPNQGYSLVSRVWGNSYDNGTFWTADIAASYGIEIYPIHGGSLYLGHDTAYVRKLWTEMEQNTGILSNDPNVNLWHDEYWKYLAFIDPDKALGLYDSYPNRNLKFGISDAQTYHWLHALKTLGVVETSVTSSHPLSAVFNNSGDTTYVVQNYGSAPIQVQFSDGFQMSVPPRSLVTSKDISLSGLLSSSFPLAYAGGSVDLSLQLQGSGADSVVFYNGNQRVGAVIQAPYQITAGQLPLGRHTFHVRMYQASNFVLSNLVEVIVGEQVPYSLQPTLIPGSFEAGHYDRFEGGNGQGIAYQDMTPINIGDTRMNESVDVFDAGSEGHAIGWIGSGEWVEYTVDVQQAGLYSMSYRFASDNQSGGGPFGLSSDGQIVKSGVAVGYTNGWNSWSSQTVSNIPLKAGVQVLRIFFDHGEFNLGKLTFTYDAPLNYSQPVADAGADQLVVLPQNTAVLDGSASTDPGGASLNHQWTQVYGPSVLQLAAPGSAQTTVSGLIPGVYLLRLDVDNGSYSDQDEVYLISSTTNNLPPAVVIQSPADQSEFFENETITVLAVASDINDSVAQVHFRLNGQWLGTDAQAPFEWQWTPQAAGTFDITAVAVDTYGDSTVSDAVQVDIVPAPPCEQSSWNGDFNYRFSPDANNPTITFIPSIAGMGSPTCILYYGTNPSNMPGHIVTPNVPYPINAAQGSTVYFYYTYSYPGQGERNNSANKDSYVIGSCKDLSLIGQQRMDIQLYPNPVKDALHFRWTGGPLTVEVFSVNGQLLGSHKLFDTREILDMSGYSEGLYIVKMSTQNGPMQTARVVKKP